MKQFAKYKKCSSRDCERAVGDKGARGMCPTHYVSWKNAGGLLAARKITTEDRFWAKVNKTSKCWAWTGSMKQNGYGNFHFRGRVEYAHRASWIIHNGDIPKGMLIDHTCFNHACVNPSHLRLVTQKQNQENRAGQRSDNTSGYRGVRFHRGKWVAEVWHNGKTVYLGRYWTKEAANAVATAKRNELFTHNDLDRNITNSKKAA